MSLQFILVAPLLLIETCLLLIMLIQDSLPSEVNGDDINGVSKHTSRSNLNFVRKVQA